MRELVRVGSISRAISKAWTYTFLSPISAALTIPHLEMMRSSRVCAQAGVHDY